jgi:hypothetical protein
VLLLNPSILPSGLHELHDRAMPMSQMICIILLLIPCRQNPFESACCSVTIDRSAHVVAADQ